MRAVMMSSTFLLKPFFGYLTIFNYINFHQSHCNEHYRRAVVIFNELREKFVVIITLFCVVKTCESAACLKLPQSYMTFLFVIEI